MKFAVFNWLKLKRNRDLPTVSAEHEGNLRYVRTSTSAGVPYVGLWDGAAYAWKELLTALTGAPIGAKYIVQQADASLTNEQATGALATGMLQSTTTSGVLATRTLTGTANQITVANGNGAAGNPTFSITTNPTLPGNVTVGGNLTITSDLDHNGSNVGFYGAAPVAKPTISGSTGNIAALSDLLADLATQGLLTNSSSASRRIQVTLGPFYLNDVPAGATTQMNFGVFNTATALSQTGNEPIMRFAGEVVGIVLVSDANCTAGTATAQVRIGGVATAFNGGSVVIDTTSLVRDADFVAVGSGVAFTAANRIGLAVTTSGAWAPTTANFVGWMVAELDPI